MQITPQECSKRQKKIADEARKEKHEMFNKLQIYMENSIQDITCELKAINKTLIENTLHVQGLLEWKRESKVDDKEEKERVAELVKKEFTWSKIAVVVCFFLNVISLLVVFIYKSDINDISEKIVTQEEIREIVRDERKDRITLEKVKEIVVQIINSK